MPAACDGGRFLDRIARAWSTLLGIGHLPLAPGTWGSLVAVVATYILASNDLLFAQWILPALVVVLSIPSALLAGRVIRQVGKEDPSLIVVDEFLGQLLVFTWVPISLTTLILGFLFFRMADILKPFPINRAERLPGGWGVVADDLLAGLLAGVCLFGLQGFLGLFRS